MGISSVKAFLSRFLDKTYLPPIRILIVIACRKGGGGLPVLAQKTPKSMQKNRIVSRSLVYKGAIEKFHTSVQRLNVILSALSPAGKALQTSPLPQQPPKLPGHK
jgi:hypothetical protein